MTQDATGFPEFTGDEALSWTTSRPNTPQLVDEYGNRTYYGTTDNEAEDFPIDSRIVEFIEYGVLNGAFERPPADPYHDITDINPLPDWRGPISVSGGAITAQWVADSGSPSGHNLRFTVNAGAADDEIYFEQIVPVSGDRARTMAVGPRMAGTVVATSGGAILARMRCQYLDATGATLGSSFESYHDCSSTGEFSQSTSAFWQTSSTPATARYLRIRIMVDRDAASASDTATIDVANVRADRGVASMMIGTAYQPDTYGPYSIYAQGGILNIADNTTGNGFSLNVATGVFSLPGGGSAVGIKFPATQVPSGDANTLDDYEESNSWTPTLAYATVGTSSWAPTVQVGTYTKIGRMVTIQFFYSGVPTNGTGAGNLQLSTLPFTPQNVSNSNARFAVSWSGVTKAGYGSVVFNCVPNSTTGNFVASGTGVAAAVLTVADIPSGGTVSFVGSGSYFV